ncbi:MAG: hypothetical protein K0R54_6168 [Clostridiaceae bacterium]|jgi:hypothetical protein|uniref:hypothetical protein n=1 Tax=Clostridium sp. YIM B02555 TaxID=2911968 RepID=UPI000983D91C|nr:hypothetical protein [Clostridium sp. YIM B02555]AQR95370.1 hypothetical protein CLSAP_26860 [Clostridium saccharoperbutylacetonicum]MDF2885592.1 hypothetical protein [Clostridiaceae bacterium]NSB31226.1 hypothetical protein [Clostridium saccharoperbutylacetonicum]
MTNYNLFRLRNKISLRKFLLNLLLFSLCPTNKFIVSLSQNLDKYIVAYQNELLLYYYSTVINEVPPNHISLINY